MFSAELTERTEKLLAACRERHLKLATAESCTGGLIAGCLTSVGGSSAVFERGFVTYSNEAKASMLGVPEDLFQKVGAVSREVAIAMAEGALARSGAQIAVSCTGIAGPGGGSPEKPVGLVHMACAAIGASTVHRKFEFGDIGRTEVRQRTVEEAMELLLKKVSEA
jgi:nicotinamide-nucleotide amidase